MSEIVSSELDRRNFITTAIGGLAWLCGVKAESKPVFFGADMGSKSDRTACTAYGIKDGKATKLGHVVEMGPEKWIVLGCPQELEGSTYRSLDEAFGAISSFALRSLQVQPDESLEAYRSRSLLNANDWREWSLNEWREV